MNITDIIADHIGSDKKLSALLSRFKFKGQVIIHVDPNDHKIADVEVRQKIRVKEPRVRSI